MSHGSADERGTEGLHPCGSLQINTYTRLSLNRGSARLWDWMEPQVASRHTSDTFGNANGVKGSNVRYFASSTGRGIKREMVDDQPKDGLYIAKSHQSPRDNSGNNGLVAMSTTSSQQGNHKLVGQQRFSAPETDVCAWLRDEPVDMSTGGLFQSGSGSALGRNSLSGGSGGTDSNLDLGGGHFVTDGSNGSPGFNATGESPDDGARRKGLGLMSTSSLYAQLRATKIKESILLEGIQRLGGGQKGLRGVIKAIMFWLEAKNRHNLQSGDPCISHSELPSPRLDEIDQFPWSNLDCGSVVDGSHSQAGQQQQHFGGQDLLVHVNLNNGRSSPPPADLSCLMNSTSSCRDSDVNGSLCAGDRGSGEYCGQVQPNYESQQPPVSAFIGMQSQGSGPGAAAGGVHRDMSSGDWVPPMREYSLPPEKGHRSRTIRKLSPSSDDSGMHSTHDLVASFDDALSQERQQGKIRRHSPTAGYSTSRQSSSVSSEFPAYLNSATPPVPEVSGAQAIFGAVGSNPFAPGGAFNPTSPPSADPHSLDFNAFGTQGSILVDESLGLGGSVPGCGPIDRFGSLGCPLSPEQSLDRKASGARLGVVSKSKASPAACTRLARKQRMDRNRKAALYQVNRGAFENNGLLAGKSGSLCSPGSLRSISRSQGSPASDGPTCRTIDRRDQENLQFLLLKVLRPSDVGNLGRIVLPKKDAESHLPWLGAREGIQFTCEDYDTGEMMTMRYRFWPNNKSRMYLLENTGDFVKKHHLQESDRMLIYRNQKQGAYIIRARKAHDCVDGLPNLDRTEDMIEDSKEITEQNSPGGPCSSGTSSLSGTESSLGSGHDGGSESRVPVPVITTSQDDLLNFADLPDAPMGEGTENLVRFPSLESFDVELLELASANKQEVTSCVGNIKEE